jgi:DNA-binding GntR family transcriptional regulator
MQRNRHDLGAFFDLDRRFHGALFAASGNRFVAKESTRVATLLHYQLQPGDSGQAGMEYGLVQHPPIITAILDRDGRAAERLMREHLGTSRDLMKQAVTALSE